MLLLDHRLLFGRLFGDFLFPFHFLLEFALEQGMQRQEGIIATLIRSVNAVIEIDNSIIVSGLGQTIKEGLLSRDGYFVEG